MAVSAGTLGAIAMPSCTSTCEEEGNCGDYKPDDATGGKAGASGSGGSGARGGSGGRGGSSGAGGRGGTGGEGGDSGAGGAGGEGGMGPDPCDPENPVAGCGVTDPDGIFVAPSGDDAASGAIDAPFETITKAINEAAGTGRTIYVCNGTYDEHLVVSDDGLVIRGGYTCPSAGTTGWLYEAGSFARIRPADPGYALHLRTIEGFTASDLDFASRDAVTPGESSVAVFAATSTAVRFARTRIVAGNGADGEDGARAGSNHSGGTLDGGPAMGSTGGAANSLECPDGSTTVGAAGGTGGPTPLSGAAGLPDYGTGGGTLGAAGGAVTDCTNGGSGSPAPARMDALGASAYGSIDATDGWLPDAGGDGLNGQPGQGGGGGGGDVGVSKGGGGGGAAGGCGGTGGPGGTGGGGSIGLLALDSDVTFDALSTIETGDAGSGGSGDAGEVGQNGGVRGTQDGAGCPGGNGGKGASGAAGGGGAGGVSVGILSKGGTISAMEVTFTLGAEGAAGQGGGAGNDGADGVAENTLVL
jgi:hypothetical protein